MSVYGDYGSGSSRRGRRGLLGKVWSVVTWPFRTIESAEARVVGWADDRRRKFRHKYRHSKVMAPLVESRAKTVKTTPTSSTGAVIGS